MQKEEKKINKEFLEKRKFNRMTGKQIEELIQREKVDEMEIKRGKNNKAYREDASRGSNIWPTVFQNRNTENSANKIMQ